MSVYVLRHAGVGYLTRDSVAGPMQVAMSDGTTVVRYDIRDYTSVTIDLSDSVRIYDQRAAEDLASRLNAREMHTRWQALRFTSALQQGL